MQLLVLPKGALQLWPLDLILSPSPPFESALKRSEEGLFAGLHARFFVFFFRVVERIILVECVIILPFFYRLFAFVCALDKGFLGDLLAHSGVKSVDHWSR